MKTSLYKKKLEVKVSIVKTNVTSTFLSSINQCCKFCFSSSVLCMFTSFF